MAVFDPRDSSNRESLSVRDVAERFIELFHHQDNPGEAFRCWVHPGYIQHNPNAPPGRDESMAFLVTAVRNHPELTHAVNRVIYGDGALVAVHHHFRRTMSERNWAVVDILRIEGGYVVEHWDVMQPVPDPAETKNENGMF